MGSQLSEEKLNDGIGQLSDELGVEINEFAVAAIQEDGEYLHQWVLGTNKDIDEKAAAKSLNNLLQDLNKNYKVARRKALKDVRVKAVRPTQLRIRFGECIFYVLAVNIFERKVVHRWRRGFTL